MAAAAQWNIGTILASRQIIPHVQNTYTKAQIRSAIETYGQQVGAETSDFFSVHCSCQGFKYFVKSNFSSEQAVNCAILKNKLEISQRSEAKRRREAQKLHEIRICLDRSNRAVSSAHCKLKDCCSATSAIFLPVEGMRHY